MFWLRRLRPSVSGHKVLDGVDEGTAEDEGTVALSETTGIDGKVED